MQNVQETANTVSEVDNASNVMMDTGSKDKVQAQPVFAENAIQSAKLAKLDQRSVPHVTTNLLSKNHLAYL